jgi:ribose transport system substrate-binding protein
MTARRSFLVLPVALTALTLSSCSKNETGATSQPTAAKYQIGFSQCTVKEPWRLLFNQELLKEAAKHPEVKLTVLDANDSTEEQVAQMRTFIHKKVDAILISPVVAAGLTGVVEEATKAGIPVVVLDRDVNTKDYPSFIGGDNIEIGRAVGRYVIAQLGGPGQAKGIVYEVCGNLAATPAQERRDGFHEIVGKEPGVQIIGGIDADWKKDRAQAVVQDALKSNPKIDVIYAHNDPMAHGAYLAAKAAGRAAGIKFVGIDGIPEEGLRWVRTGELTASFLYPPPGQKGLQVALDILARKPVEKRIILPSRLYTKDNVDQGGTPIETPASQPAISQPAK